MTWARLLSMQTLRWITRTLRHLQSAKSELTGDGSVPQCQTFRKSMPRVVLHLFSRTYSPHILGMNSLSSDLH